MNHPPQMACRQCRQPLNTLGHPAAPTYVHPAHKGPANHQPDPIPIGDLDTVDYVCDFCGDPQALWSLRGGEIRTVTDTGADKLIQDYGQRWSACAACEADADTGRIDAITDRAAKAMNITYTSGREQVVAMHRAFFDNRQPGRHLVTTQLWPPANLIAHDLPKVRDRLTRLLADPDQLPDHLPDDQTTTIADHLDQAALYWVDPDFTDLADHATTDLPASPLHSDDLPTTHGLVIWARPLTDRLIHAAIWTTVHNGLIVAAYRSIGTGLPPVLLQRTREQAGWLAPIRTLHLPDRHLIPVGHPAAALAATCLLIAQQLADTTAVEPDKSTRRSYARANRPVPEVRLVRIKGRAVTRAHRSTTTQNRAALDHREWVGGHWKQQAHGPGRTQRRLIYVAPYLRGPDDQPIRTSTTVRVLGTLPTRPAEEPDNA